MKWRMDDAVAVLSDPTSSYGQMAKAFKEASACVQSLYRKSMEWEDADTERTAQALAEIAEEVGGKIFNSPLRRELGTGEKP